MYDKNDSRHKKQKQYKITSFCHLYGKLFHFLFILITFPKILHFCLTKTKLEQSHILA